MTYLTIDDLAEHTISRARAHWALRQHFDGEQLHAAWAQFLAEMGDGDEYNARTVVEWLGY